MNFARLSRGHAIAMVAAFALLFAMALTWYSTIGGYTARQIEELAQPRGLDTEGLENIREDARFAAESQERNAWQADGAIDRIILAGLLATIVLAIGVAYWRAAGRGQGGVLKPAAAASGTAALTAVLVAYRMLQEPGLDATATVEAGAPLSLGLLTAIAFAGSAAARAEEHDETYHRDPLIEREQVLHVARLARLRLDDAEVKRMTGELSSILDHIEKISELDLEGVEPTSHVVDLENVLRADEPRPGLSRERALAPAPVADGSGFRVPSPGS